MATNLRSAGVEVQFNRTDNHGRRMVAVSWRGASAENIFSIVS